MIEVDDSFVVVPAHVVGRGAVSGLQIDSVFGWMYECQDGQLPFASTPTRRPMTRLQAARSLADAG